MISDGSERDSASDSVTADGFKIRADIHILGNFHILSSLLCNLFISIFIHFTDGTVNIVVGDPGLGKVCL